VEVSSLSERTPDFWAIFRLVGCILVLVIVVWPLAACLPSKVTPPPVTVPAPPPVNGTTPPPVTTPAPPPVTVEVELSGKIDTSGILLEDIEVISDDGHAILLLSKRMRMVDAQGKAPDSITVTARPRGESPPGSEWWLCGLRYDFNPKGVTLSPPAQLTISYDPSLVNLEEVNVYNPRLGCFEEADLTWTWLDVTADWDNHCITAEITRTGVFVVSFEIWPTHLIS